MTSMAYAFLNAGLVTEDQVRNSNLSLRERLERALHRAQKTGNPADWQEYASLKRRAPRKLRFMY